MAKAHHVIVGASAAGVSAAMAMRTNGFDGQITLLESQHHLPYELPPLSKNVVGDASQLVPIVAEEQYASAEVDLRLGVSVERVSPGDSSVRLHDGTELRVDRVLLATGLAARTLEVPGSTLDGIMVLRNAADAVELSSRFHAGGPLVVVGAGFIGLELAAVARAAGIEATVVELASSPLAGVSPIVGEMLRRLHESRGVRFRMGVSVERFEGSTSVECVDLSDGSRVPAATVVVGVGAVARDELAAAAGVSVAGGVLVDEFGRTSNPHIFAAGDIAVQPHPHLHLPGRIEHWDSALKHGAAVGATMAGTPSEFREAPFAWSDQYEATLQMFGRPFNGDEFTLRSDASPERFIGFWTREGVLVAAIAYGQPKEVRAARALIDLSVRVERAVLSASDTDLMALRRSQSRA